MSEQEIKNSILGYILNEFNINDIEEVETNAGSCFMRMKDGETYYIIVEKCEDDD